MLSTIDIVAGLVCVLLLYRVLVINIRKFGFEERRVIRKAFGFRVICVVVYSLITAYYYEGGDTEMFFHATGDMQKAISNGDLSLGELLLMEDAKTNEHILSYYFQLDDIKYPVRGFMADAGNFMVPKLGVIPYMIFFKSYIALCLFFSFFALVGSIMLYRLFNSYFPSMNREASIAFLLLPSVCYWSSGFLKDSICFGSIGILLYGLHGILITRKKILRNFLLVVICIYLLYTIKVYILLALIPAIFFWLFGEIRNLTRNQLARKALTFGAVLAAVAGALAMLSYMTSEAALSKFSLENIMETSNSSREMYAGQSEFVQSGSYFTINTTNPVLLALNGFVATFFRPFPWEVSSAIVMLSAIEALAFLSLLVMLIYQKGIRLLFANIFASPILQLCFMFSLIFSISVGVSATNFGSLSRYKIPCLPFYLMFVLISYNLLGVKYPKWFMSVLSVIKKRR